MAYVIYNVNSTRLLNDKTYASMPAAKAGLTRAVNTTPELISRENYAIADYSDFYTNIEKQVERTNMMSGVKYMEGVNTKGFMSPASESYWSM